MIGRDDKLFLRKIVSGKLKRLLSGYEGCKLVGECVMDSGGVVLL